MAAVAPMISLTPDQCQVVLAAIRERRLRMNIGPGMIHAQRQDDLLEAVETQLEQAYPAIKAAWDSWGAKG